MSAKGGKEASEGKQLVGSPCVGVIGSAGRGADAKLMSGALFNRMCEEASKVILGNWKLTNEGADSNGEGLTLVSGGSAWCDHIAVHLFLHDPRFSKAKLLLFLPCRFVGATFVDEQSWHTNAKTLNQLHANFSKTVGYSSLGELKAAKEKGATFDSSGRGFFARNLLLGKKATHLIAFSFSDNELSPSDGGTAHTWKNAVAPSTNRRHIPIKSLLRSKQTSL